MLPFLIAKGSPEFDGLICVSIACFDVQNLCHPPSCAHKSPAMPPASATKYKSLPSHPFLPSSPQARPFSRAGFIPSSCPLNDPLHNASPSTTSSKVLCEDSWNQRTLTLALDGGISNAQIRPTSSGSASFSSIVLAFTDPFLQVLLPPRTALIYSNLLRAETVELAKDRAANWDRIMQIRHLKDRMIRKCQRLVKASAPTDKNTARVMFFTLHAPPDFRLKEMERWFRSQGSEFADVQAEPTKSSAPYCCSKCGPLNNPSLPQPNTTPRRAPSLSARPQQQPTKATSQLTRSASERVSRRPPVPPTFPTPEVKSSSTSYKHRQPKPPIPVPHRPPPPSVRSTSVPRQPKAVTSPPRPAPEQQPHHRQPRQRSPQHEPRAESHPARTFVKSPEPLPIPYRSPEQRLEEEALKVEPEVQVPVPPVSSSPLSYAELLPEPEVLPPREPSPTSTLVDLPSVVANSHNGNGGGNAFAGASGQPLETIHEKPEGSEVATQRPPLVRRRSSLKNGGGMSRLSMVSQTKSVTWAMDRDWVEQMSKYENATQEAEVVCECLNFSVALRTLFGPMIVFSLFRSSRRFFRFVPYVFSNRSGTG